ncbi:hypothetical protein [Hymenobacter crusticola]|uniref:hypothetical protein n=1 Tax=Hymenobacter crusticola TaxID=1770526 RepID=UPI0015C501A4|nr:hypothetical protein [Hymenobacter crusticola]
MKNSQQRPKDEDEMQLQAVLSADQYAKYQSQQAAGKHKYNGMSGRRPPRR